MIFQRGFLRPAHYAFYAARHGAGVGAICDKFSNRSKELNLILNLIDVFTIDSPWSIDCQTSKIVSPVTNDFIKAIMSGRLFI